MKQEKIGYDKLHKWLRKHKPKPKCCEFCKKEPARHISKVTEQYTKNLEDYKYLCVKCHRRLDRKYPSKQKAPQSALGNGNFIMVVEQSIKLTGGHKKHEII